MCECFVVTVATIITSIFSNVDFSLKINIELVTKWDSHQIQNPIKINASQAITWKSKKALWLKSVQSHYKTYISASNTHMKIDFV